MVDAESLWNDVRGIRYAKPLIHNITNYVAMNSTANALLAVGASPVMAHALDEVAEMTGMAKALVINVGTLSIEWIKSMTRAVEAADVKFLVTFSSRFVGPFAQAQQAVRAGKIGDLLVANFTYIMAGGPLAGFTATKEYAERVGGVRRTRDLPARRRAPSHELANLPPGDGRQP